MKTAKPLIEGVKGKILHVYADIYGFVYVLFLCSNHTWLTAMKLSNPQQHAESAG